MRTKLSKSWYSQNKLGLGGNSQSQVQEGQYAPPPGPPPQWSQWQTPLSSEPPTQVHAYTTQNNSRNGSRTSSTSAARIVSREEEIQRLFKACETGKGNAQLLREAVVYTKPQELKDNDIIEEFRGKCRNSQELICSTIPWATAEIDHAKGSSSRRGGVSEEERLLAELLAANQELLDALQTYDDLARAGTEQEERDQKKAERKLRALDAITCFQPTSAESALVDQIFAVADPSGGSTISSHAAYKLFTGTRLPPNVLTSIWEIANVEENDLFGKHCVGVALRLVGHAQHGKAITEALVNEAGPLASIDGFDASRRETPYNAAGSSSNSYNSPSSPISASSPSPNILPPLTPQDRTKFVRIFYSSGPENDVLSAQRARDILLKSKLPLSTLGQIWELSDTQLRGVLDVPAFCIAMYLVQGCMSGQITNVPPSLPPFLYAAAAEAVPTSSPQMQGTPSDSSRSPAVSDSWRAPAWAVSAELKASADAFFDVLDEEKKGYLDGETARSHFLQSGLPQDALTHVWRLADVNADGRLTRDEFAIALYLVQSRESGQQLPQTLPASLIPPASRSTSGTQTPQFPQPSVQDEDLLIDLDGPEEPVRMPMPTITVRTPPRVSPPMPPPISPTSSAIWRPAASSLPPRSPASSSSAPSPIFTSSQPPITSTEWTWEIPPADRASSDKFFDQLDPWKQGNLEGDAAVPFLSRSKLPHELLARIWELADRDHDGRLDKDEFAVVMFLIRGRLAGRALPESVPLSMFEPPPEPAPVETSSLGSGSAQQSVSVTPEMVSSVPAVAEQSRPDEPPPPYQENIPEDA